MIKIYHIVSQIVANTPPRTKSFSYSLIFFLLLFTPAVAQRHISVPYSFGFEEDEQAEISNWVLNPGQESDTIWDKWFIGTSAASEGKRSMYISCDSSLTDHYGAEGAIIQYAYRDFTIDKGSYNLTFDWRCLGAANASLYVGVYDSATIADTMHVDHKGVLPQDILTGCPTATSNLYGSQEWQNGTLQFTASATRTCRILYGSVPTKAKKCRCQLLLA